MRFLFVFIILSSFAKVFGNELSNSTSVPYFYEDDTGLGNIIGDNWSIERIEYDHQYIYECSGIAGSSDC
jgi:hypothetical protein